MPFIVQLGVFVFVWLAAFLYLIEVKDQTMNVIIRVFKNAILVQVGQGQIHTFYDWVMVLDLIQPEDTVFVQDYQ